MPRMIQTPVYKFEELAPKIQEKVKERYLDFEGENWDAYNSGCKEHIYTALKLFGFKNSNFRFSGFGRQGDGASFSGRWHPKTFDPTKIKEEFPKAEDYHAFADELAEFAKTLPDNLKCIEITTNDGLYCHEYTMAVNDALNENDESVYVGEKLWAYTDEADTFWELVCNIARSFYKYLNDDYDWTTDDERFTAYLSEREGTDEEPEYYADGRVYEK